MAFDLTDRMGVSVENPDESDFHRILDSLARVDPEHPDVSLTHESEWSLGVFGSGLVIWENLEGGEPRHARNLGRDEIIALWKKLAVGDIAGVDSAVNWQSGYG